VADIVWSTTKLPPAILGVPYEAGLAVTGNATAFTAATVSTGSLPPGLALAADKVRITGTPTALGSFTFVVTLTDTAGAVASPSFTIRVRDEVPGDDASLPTADLVAAHGARLRL
jgi:large repetitive protein